MISPTSMSGAAAEGSIAAAGMAFTVPLSLVSGQVFQHGRATHVAPVARVFECGSAMHGAAIVPDYEIAGLLPRHGAHELRLGRELDQVADQRAAFFQRQAEHVRSMGRDVQRLAMRARMNLNQL